MNDDNIPKIEPQDQETLLNLTPSETEGVNGITDTDKDKDKKKKKKQPNTNKGEGRVVDLDNEEPAFTSENPNKTTERDYSLDPAEFKKKYIDVPESETPFEAFNPGSFNELDSINYGKGIEDYRDYLDSPIKGKNNDLNRALNQDNLEQIGNATARFVLNVLPEFIQQGANIGEGLFNFATQRDSYGNPISEAMGEWKEQVSRDFDIYMENPDGALEIGDFAWWADRGSSLATSVAAFVALGYLTGGASLATRTAGAIAKTGTRGTKIANVLKGTIGKGTKIDDVAKAVSLGKTSLNPASFIDTLTSSYLLTTAESIGTATDVYNTVYEEAKNKANIAGLGEKESEIKARGEALKAGDRAFNFNQWNILLNLTSVAPFLRRSNNTKKGFIKKRTPLGGAKKIAAEGAQEYLEESVNFLSERYATDENYSLSKALKDMGTLEGFEAGLLGLAGGVGQTGLTSSGQYLKLRKGKDGRRTSDYQRYKKEYAAQEDLREQFSKWSKAEKQNTGDFFLTVDEQTKLHNKINVLYGNIEDGIDVEENTRKIEETKEQLFTFQAYQAFQSGLGDEFKSSLESLSSLTDEEAIRLGYDVEGENNYRPVIAERIATLDALQNIYERTSKLYKGNTAYDLASEKYYFENLKKNREKKLQGYLDVINPKIEELTDVSEGSFTFDVETGTYKFDQTELEATVEGELTKEVEDKNTEISKLDQSIAKEKDRLKVAKGTPGTDNTQQISAIEKTLNKLDKDKDTLLKDLHTKEENLKDSKKRTRVLTAQVEQFIELLEETNPYIQFTSLAASLKELDTAIEMRENSFNDLTSFEGQQKAKEQHRKASIEHARAVAKQKAKDKEASRKSKYNKAKKDKEGEEETKEEKGEEETVVHTDTDKKGRKHTFFATTKESKGLTKTSYTFNRSDKDSTQRSTASIPLNVALGDKYTVPKETENTDGSMSDQVPEGAEIVTVLEIREGEGRAGATVTFQLKEDPTQQWKGEVVLEINPKYNSKANKKPTSKNPIKNLAEFPSENVTKELIIETLDLSDGEVIDSLYSVLSKVKSVAVKEDLVAGVLKKYYKDNAGHKDAKSITKLYNALTKIGGDDLSYSAVSIISADNTLEEGLNNFLNTQASVDIANEIDGSTFSFSVSDDTDQESTEDFIESINQEEDRDKVRNFETLVVKLLAGSGLTIDDSFDKIVKTINEEVGAELTKRIFYKLQGYVSYRTGKRLNKFYSTIVKTKAERDQEAQERKRKEQSGTLEDFPIPTLEEIEENNKQNAVAEIALSEGILVEDVEFENEDTYTSAKTLHAATKVAYKVIGSKRVYLGGNLIDKQTVHNFNFNTDPRLLIPDGIKIGDEVSFEIVESMTKEDGTIFTTFEKDGEWFTKVKKVNEPEDTFSALEKAPIAIIVNGQILQDAFLHVPEFINSENLVAEKTNLENEKLQLEVLRQKVIKGDNIATKVNFVSKGHLIKTKRQKTKVNLSSVKTAIFDGTSFRINENKEDNITPTKDRKYLTGVPYALIPEEDGSFDFYPLHRDYLNLNQIDTVIDLFRLKLSGEETLDSGDFDKIARYKAKGIDLRSFERADYEAFNNLLQNIIQTNTFNENDFNINEAISKYNRPIFFMKRTFDGISFKAGKEKLAVLEFEVKNNNSLDKETLEENLNVLKVLLKQTRVNFNINNVGRKAFIPFTSIEGEGGVLEYDEFIKDNTTVDIVGVIVEDQVVYKVQKSVYFDAEEGKETPKDDGEDEHNFGDVDMAFNITENEDLSEELELEALSEEMLSIIEVNDEDGKLIQEVMNKELYIPNFPVVYQDKFVEAIVSIITKNVGINDLLGIANAKKKTKVFTADKAKQTFKKNVENYLRLQENIKESYTLLIKGLESGKSLESFGKNFKNTDLYKVLESKKDPIKYLKNKVEQFPEDKRIALLALENVDQLMSFATHKIKSYTLINSIKQDNDEIEEQEQELGKNIRTNFDDEYTFSLNGKDQLSANVKNILIGINDADLTGYKVIRKGKDVIKVPILKNKTIFGLDVTVPFDRLYDEAMLILATAYKNYESKVSNNNSLFDTYIEELSFHIEKKPYMQNLVTRLQGLNSADKNAFATNMSKATVNHITTYMTESRSTAQGELSKVNIFLANKSTNSNENSLAILKTWQDDFYNSDLVKEIDDKEDITFNKDKVLEFFKKVDSLLLTAREHQKLKLKELRSGLKGNASIDIDRIRQESYLPDEEIIKELSEGFSSLGFTFSDELLSNLYTGSYKSKGNKIRLGNLNDKAGFFGALRTVLLDKDNNLRKINIKNTPIFNDGYIQEFGKYVTRFNTQLYASSYTNGEGKNIYGYALPKYLTDRLRDLKTNPKLLQEIKDDVFQGKSRLLDELYDEKTGEIKNTKFTQFFNYFTFDTNVITKRNFNAKRLNKLSSAGYEQVSLNLYFNKGNESGDKLRNITVDGIEKPFTYRNGKLFAPTFSDKKTPMGLNSMIYNVEVNSDGNIDADSYIYDILLDEVVMPEYNRIRAQQFNDDVPNIENYEEASKLFYFIPELNYMDDNFLFDVERDDEGAIVSKTLKDIDQSASLKAKLKQAVIRHIDNLKRNKKEIWEDFDIVRNGRLRFVDTNFTQKGFDTNVDRIAYEYVINYLISNANFFKLFAGDPALYYKSNRKDNLYDIKKDETDEYSYANRIERDIANDIKSTFDNIGKRLASQIAPGTDIISDVNEKVTWAVITDVEDLGIEGVSISSNIEYHEKLFGKERARRTYGNMAGGDGQGVSTFKEWATIEYKRGNITEQDRTRLITLEKRKKLSPSDLEQINNILYRNKVNSYKPVYFNNYKDGNVFRSLYVKQSSLPLISQITQNLEIDNLRVAMVRDGIDHVVFASAVKLGRPTETFSLYDNKGKFKEDISFNTFDDKGNPKLSKNVITSPRQGHKIQLDTVDLSKKRITDGSQQRKLIFTDILNVKDFKHPASGQNVSGQSLREEFNRYYVEVFKNKYKELVEELGYDEENKSLDLQVLQKVLFDEFEQRNYPLSDLSYLGIVENKKGGYDFKQPLWTSPLSSKIESLLVSIVNNRVRSLKSQGHSFILSSNVGFRPQQLKEGSEATEFIKANRTGIVFDKEWYERGDFTLRGQKEGSPAEIMIPSKFRDSEGNVISAKDFMTKDGYIDTSKISEDLLKMFGYRIPTQGLNSMSYMKVVGFLPDEYSETILAPSEFTVQMGSDFDIDKLYVNFYEYATDLDGKLNKIPSTYITSEESFDEDYHNVGNDEKNQRLFNSILDIKLAILSNPNDVVQKKILAPLDENVFEDLAKELEELTVSNDDFYSPISQEQFKGKFLSGSNGNDAIGVFARASTLNVLLQDTDTNKHYFQAKDEKGRFTNKKVVFGIGTKSNGKVRWSKTLSDTRLDGSTLTKSDVFSMLITSAVDNENLQVLGKLNINSETYNFIVGMVMSGYPADFIVYMINQPIVKEYTELSMKVKDPSIGYKGVQRLEELHKKYGGHLNSQEEYEETGKYFKEVDLKDASFNFNVEALKENIKTNNNFFANEQVEQDFKVQQTAILQRYLFTQGIFGRLTEVQEAINIDGSGGLGSSLVYLNEKEKQIRELGASGIQDVLDLLGETFEVPNGKLDEETEAQLLDTGFVSYAKGEKGDIFLRPTTIVGAMAVYGVMKGNEIYNSNDSLFPYKNSVIETLSNIAYQKLKLESYESTLKDTVDLKRKAINYTRQFLYSGFFDNLYTGTVFQERKRLLVDRGDKESFATILSDIKSQDVSRFNNNYLLARLNISRGGDYSIGTIVFNATNETTQMNFISSSIIELLQDESVWYNKGAIQYRGKDIAMDLIRHQYVTGGVQFRKQFIKYIPAEVFEALGVGEKVRGADFNNMKDKDFKLLTTRFTTQLLQHLPKLVTTEFDTANYDPNSETLLVPLEDKTPNMGRGYVEGIEVLFKKIGVVEENAIYKVIDFAGDSDNFFAEFDSSVDTIKSIVPYNNKIIEAEDSAANWNSLLLQKTLNNDVVYVTKEEDEVKWSTRTGSKEEYLSMVEAYINDGEEHLIKKVSEKDGLGNVIIFDTAKFKGIVNNTSDRISFNDNLKEGEDFSNVEPGTKNTVGLTNIQRVKQTFNIEHTDTENTMRNILDVLKANSTDVTRNYMYDVMMDALPSLIEQNPHMKLNLFDSPTANGVVEALNGEILSISLNVNKLNNFILDGKNYNKNNTHNLIVEEFLHAFTLSKALKDTVYYEQLSQIRDDYISDLKANNPAGYAEYLGVVEKVKARETIFSLLKDPDTTVALIEKRLKTVKNDAVSIQVQKAVDKAKEKGDLYINLTALRDSLLKTYAIKGESNKHYYALTNVDEFIAAMFYNPQIQNGLNLVKDKNKKSLLERLVSLILRALRSLGLNKVVKGKASAWDRIFQDDINPDSLLEAGVTKTILLIKDYKKTKFSRKEKTILSKRFEEFKEDKSFITDAKGINKVFGLVQEGELQYVENGAEIASLIRKTFSNLEVTTKNTNYVIVSEKGTSVDLNELTFGESKKRKGNDTDPDSQYKIDFTARFNLEFASEEDLNKTRKAKLLSLNNSRIKKLSSMLDITRTAITTSKSAEVKRKNETRFRFLTELINELSSKESLESLQSIEGLEQLASLGEKDLEQIDAMLHRDNLSFSDIVYAKQVLSNWESVFSSYFTKEEEKYAKGLVEVFQPIVSEARVLTTLLNEKLVSLYELGIKKEFNKNIDLLDMFKDFKDVGLFDKEGTDISRVNNIFLSFIHQKNQRAFNQTKRETYDEIQEVEGFLGAALPHLKKYSNKKNGLFNILLQKYEDGTGTGDLVNAFSKEYTDKQREVFSLLRVVNEDEKIENAKEVNKWLKENTIYFNPHVLYREEASEEERAAHIAELKEILGEDLYSHFKEQQDNKIAEYEITKKLKLSDLLVLNGVETLKDLEAFPEAISEYEIWKASNSPYVHFNEVMTGEPKLVDVVNNKGEYYSRKVYNTGYESLINVPLRKKGDKETSYYDKDFDIILKDAEIFAFYKAYKQVLDRLSVYLPKSQQDAIRYNGLPEIRKAFIENITQDGFSGIHTTLMDNFKESIRIDDMSQISSADLDGVTGEKNRILDFSLFKNNYKEFQEYLNDRVIEYELSNDGLAPPSNFNQLIEKEFNNLVAERKSKDLGKLLKAYAGLALTYKHKSRVQDAVTAGTILINSLKEDELNPQSKSVYDKYKQRLFKPTSSSYHHLKEMYQHYLENFFGTPYKLQGVGKSRIETSAEKKRKVNLQIAADGLDKALEALEFEYQSNDIKHNNYLLRKEYLEGQKEEVQLSLEELGGSIVYSKLGDQALQFFQLKGMGWNFLAGIGNLGYGIIGNLVESADGRIINRKEMREAMTLTLHSIGRNATFHLKETDTALKIRSIMDRNDILKEASHELYSNSVKGTFAKKMRFAMPYNVQKRTEYLNQAPIMIAFYRKTMHEYAKGQEVSLWDAYKKDGQWDSTLYGAEPDLLVNKINSKITQFIKRVHGNYDPSSPMKIKQGILGRSIAQFRSWFVEAFKQRWEGEVYDDILEANFKGRYRTFKSYAKSERSNGNQYGYPGMLLDLFKGLLLNVVMQKTTFENQGISEVDAVNMRKIVSELTLYLSLMSFYIAMNLMFRGDDEDKLTAKEVEDYKRLGIKVPYSKLPDSQQHALNLILNLTNRIKDELTIYGNPLEAVAMASNPAPSMSLIEDTAGLFDAFSKTIMGDGTIDTGTYSGQNRIVRGLSGFVPFLAQGKSIQSNAKQEFNIGSLDAILSKLRTDEDDEGKDN
tara:strand:+ start:12892 stop:30153 length:17262 start_codon:yes stop_codon:yes gene_type:complete